MKVGRTCSRTPRAPPARCGGQRFDDATEVRERRCSPWTSTRRASTATTSIRPPFRRSRTSASATSSWARRPPPQQREAQRIRLATIIAAPPKRPALFDEPDRASTPPPRAWSTPSTCSAPPGTRCSVSRTISSCGVRPTCSTRCARARPARRSTRWTSTDAQRGPARPGCDHRARGVRTHNLDGVDVDPTRRDDRDRRSLWRGKSPWPSTPSRRPAAPVPALPGAPVHGARRAPSRSRHRPPVALAVGRRPAVRRPSRRRSGWRMSPLARAGDGRGRPGSARRRRPGGCPAGRRGPRPDAALVEASRPTARSPRGGSQGGTRPGAFFTEPEGQHLATLRAATGTARASGTNSPRRSAVSRSREPATRSSVVRAPGAQAGRAHLRGRAGLLRLVEEEAARRSQ